MGYTNYWYQHEDFTEDEWMKIKIFYHGLNTVHGGGFLQGADHIMQDETTVMVIIYSFQWQLKVKIMKLLCFQKM